MDKEIILKYKEVTGESLINSLIKYKTKDRRIFELLILIYQYKKDSLTTFLFETSTINIK